MVMPKQKPGRSKQDYGTPKDFLATLKRFLSTQDFVVDLAADISNTVASVFITKEEDSLKQDWEAYSSGWAYLNPPFSHISPWVRKASEITKARIAMLVPASVGSNWWRDWVDKKAYVLFLNGRLTFVGETASYPKDCAILLYTPLKIIRYEVWNWRSQ